MSLYKLKIKQNYENMKEYQRKYFYIIFIKEKKRKIKNNHYTEL